MSYRVVLTRGAVRQLQEVPEKAAPALIEMLYGAIAENPQRAGRRLSLELEGRWSARRGDYRVVYRIDEDARVDLRFTEQDVRQRGTVCAIERASSSSALNRARSR